ncbi:MAG: site-2 protease family protein [Phycisphaerales bacterium]|nr:MAG: site-2 protease family protein [Phycisphaerales bacterium]
MLADYPVLTTATVLMEVPAVLGKLGGIALMLLGFSLVVFVHELGHFLAAKWAGVRVDKFCVGFGKELFGFTRKSTRYSFNALPVGGYVKMLGQEDFAVDKDGDWSFKGDPDSFTNKPVGIRMIIVSAGVVMNLVFAAVVFMFVYMVGMPSLAPIVGFVAPGSPADLAGIQVGDRVVEIDGSRVQGFQDIKMATVLAEPHEPLTVALERHGQRYECPLVPSVSPADGLLWLGIGPGFTNRISYVTDYVAAPGKPRLEAGDMVASVNGQEADSFMAIWKAMMDARGAPVRLMVERPEKLVSGSPRHEAEAYVRAPFDLQPSLWDADGIRVGSKNFMGLVPRRTVLQVSPELRAELAGFRDGDVVVRWDGIDNPTYDEIIDSIQASPEVDLRVSMLRDNQVQHLVVRPKQTGGLFRKGRIMVGASFDALEERAVSTPDGTGLVVADIWPEVGGVPTPAAALLAHEGGAGEPIRRGALIEAIDGQPISSWFELVDRFRTKAGAVARAGSDVGEIRVTYRNPDGASHTRTMPLPTSLCSATGLPGSALILSIDGEKWVSVKDPSGRPREVSVAHWRGAQEALEQRAGRTVEVAYFCLGEWEEKRVSFTVTKNNTDPWLMRLNSRNALLSIMLEPVMEPIKVSNPLAAVWVGVRQTGYIIMNVYMTMQRMIFTRTVGLENMSGPVGIVKMGTEFAEAGLNRLFWFLAVISANLAVINFLPLPIVDGGLMIFLLIELIKGQPVSLKTQVVTQVIGLALIIAAFVFVTAMDISKIAAP